MHHAAKHNDAPSAPFEEMVRLHHAGLSLLPLGNGADGKGPLLAFKGQSRLPLRRVFAPMHRTGSTCYGVRLSQLAVIDCDEDNPVLVQQMEARFGASPVHVRTPRGRHLYYRSEGGQFPNLRGEGLPVDIKRGLGSYVMGPGSVRPDGGRYTPAKGILGKDNLPEISLPARAGGRRIREGSRNYALTLAAIEMVESVDDPDELLGNLQFIRDDECEDPATVPVSELQKITDWAWQRRLEGKVYHGKNSEFRLHRQALDALKGLPNASDSIALLAILQALHGHVAGKAFALNYDGMKRTGHTDLSRDRFLAARRSLQAAGLLQVAANHQAGKTARTYRLARPLNATGVTALHPQSQGEGVY